MGRCCIYIGLRYKYTSKLDICAARTNTYSIEYFFKDIATNNIEFQLLGFEEN